MLTGEDKRFNLLMPPSISISSQTQTTLYQMLLFLYQPAVLCSLKEQGYDLIDSHVTFKAYIIISPLASWAH